MSKREVFEITGSGGGKGGKTIADNLQSRAVARFIDLISEGPIVGLINGAKSIYFNETPLQNEDGSMNFENVIWQDRKGLPDDVHLNGNASVEQVLSVEVEVKNSGVPIQRTVTAPDADAIRVVMRLNSLFRVDDKGNSKNFSVSYVIDIRPAGGTWVRAVTKDISNRKTSSATQIAHRIQLPAGVSSWDVRVTRLSPDDADEKHQSVIFWESYVTMIEGRFTYPHSALVAIEVNAEDLGTQIPARTYHVKGRIISVPVNYDPVARTFAGIWDGTFKQAWTNDPAWIFYDLIENDRYGIGEFVDTSQIDKWSLYEISKNNNGMVKSGFKDGAGADIMEPRYTFNGVIQDREDAYFALQKITTAWRGMGYWAIGQYFATADMPSDPVKLVTPANVINGEFVYSSTSMKARHNVALVNWNDPINHFKPEPEVEILDEYMQKNGWRETRVDLVGCTSRGLALRYARWMLDTENTATETVTYSASFDHADIHPGHIITVADPRRALVRMGGRILAHTVDTVTLDADIELLVGETYQIYLTKADGSIQMLNVIGKVSPGIYNLTTTPDLSLPGSVFIMTGTDVNPVPFRVVSISETEPNIFSVSALRHDPLKYDRIENGVHAAAPTYARERPASPPTDSTSIQENYIEGGVAKSKITVSWKPPVGVIVANYVVSMESSSEGKSIVGSTSNTSIDLTGLSTDTYKIEIVTIDRKGVQSSPLILTIAVQGSQSIIGSSVVGLISTGSSTISFEGGDAAIKWTNNFPDSSNSATVIGASPLYLYNVIEVRDDLLNTLLRTEQIVGNIYTYSFDANNADSIAAGFVTPRRDIKFLVKVVDINGNQSGFTSLSVSNVAPALSAPSISVKNLEIEVAWLNPTDIDYKGTLVWISKTAINTATDIPSFDGVGGVVYFTGTELSNYNVKIAHYDLFGKIGINVSANSVVTTGYDQLTAINASVANNQSAIVSLNSAVTSQGSALTSEITKRSLMFDDPTLINGLSLFSHSQTGAAEVVSTASANLSTRASSDAIVGGLDIVISGNSSIHSKRLFPIKTDHKYKLTVRVKREAYSSGSPLLYAGFDCLNSDGLITVGANSGYKYPLAQGLSVAQFPVGDFVELTTIITGEGVSVTQFASGTKSIRLMLLGNYGSTDTGNVMAVSYFDIEDVSEIQSVKATVDIQATALATIAGNANATYSIRAKAGTSGAVGEFVASDDPISGPASAIRLSSDLLQVTAKNILFTGGAGSALNIDPNVSDASAWSYVTPANIITVADGKTGATVLRGLANVNSHFAGLPFQVSSSKKYRIRGTGRKNSSANGISHLRVYWYNGLDSFISYDDSSFALTTNLMEYSHRNITPPIGAVFARIYVIPNYYGTLGYHEWQGVIFDEMIDTSLVIDGAFTAAGLAIFGGGLQSDDFVTMTTGFQIKKDGSAEFNQLVSRQWMKDGSVSDKIFTAVADPITLNIASDQIIVIASLSIGQTLPNQIRKYGFSYEHKTNNGAVLEVKSQIRFKYLGVWGAWINKGNSTSTASWDSDGISGTLAGVYDDAELQLIVQRIGSSGSPPSNVIKNVYVTCVNLVK